jgi:hypothetical protein
VAQAKLAEQVVAQAVVEAQPYAPQVPATGDDCLQVPAPSQPPVVVEVDPLPEQRNMPGQLVPDTVKAQPPPPLPPLLLHRPVWPQVVPSDEHSLSGSVLAVTAAQWPLAAPVLAWTQASQVPPQALLQQTPSVQKPELHWSVALQVEPSAPWAVHMWVVRLQ